MSLSNKKSEPQLTTTDAVALTISSMVGAGIFAILGLTVQTAGPASVLSWIGVVVISFPMACTFSDLVGVLSASGGPYIYLMQKTNPVIGWLAAWSFLISALGAAAALWMALVGMMKQVGVPAPTWLGITIMAVLTLAVSRGIHMGARLQRILTGGTLVLLLVCIVTGLYHAKWLPGMNVNEAAPGEFLHVLAPHGWAAVLPAMFLAFWTYSGWEAVTVPSGSYRSLTGLARGMMMGSVVVGLLYILVALASVLSVPAHVLTGKVNPLVDVGALWNPWVANCIAWGALVIVISSLLSWFIASSTLIQALIRDGLIPAPLRLQWHGGAYHPVLPCATAVLLLLLTRIPNFSAVIAASSMTALIPYAMVFLTVARDRDANWSGFIKTARTRRFMAGLAFATALLLILFSGYQNLWPSLLLLAAGWVLIQLRRRKLRSTVPHATRVRAERHLSKDPS